MLYLGLIKNILDTGTVTIRIAYTFRGNIIPYTYYLVSSFNSKFEFNQKYSFLIKCLLCAFKSLQDLNQMQSFTEKLNNKIFEVI